MNQISLPNLRNYQSLTERSEQDKNTPFNPAFDSNRSEEKLPFLKDNALKFKKISRSSNMSPNRSKRYESVDPYD